jgi:DNA-binding transcriptional ArsR family regulator
VHAQTVDVNRVFHALSDATRRQMIERLSEGPVSASELAKPLGVSLAAVVQHLQLLEECSLVRSEKVGRTRLCRMESAGLRAVEKWITDRRASWERKFDRLGDLLAEDPPLPDADP